MILSKDRNTLFIGDVSAVSSPSISINKYIYVIALVLSLIGLFLASQLKVLDGVNPAAVALVLVVMSAAVFGAMTAFATVLREVTGNADVRLVTIDTNRQCLDVYQPTGIGLGVKQVNFSDIVEIRSTRGDWNGDAVVSNTAISTHANGSIIVPAVLDDFEVMVMAYYIGLRESSMLLAPREGA